MSSRVATDTPEYISPATSSVVHGRLCMPRAGTFDVNCGCAGYVTALDVAWKYIRADERYRRVLVVGAYAMSKYIDWGDKKTATIFADGAGATVVELSDRPGILASELYADGRLAPGMGVFAGGTAEPITEAVLRDGTRTRLRFVQKYPREVNEADYDATLPAMTEDGGMPEEVQRRDTAVRAEVNGLAHYPPPEQIYDYSVVREVYRELRAAGWQPAR